jgi:curved DNA-binding protein CbpA
VATHYEVLGVDPGAGTEEIQRAYRRLARRHHPDVAPDTDRTRMAEINNAWAVLGDPTRRRIYDALLREPEPPPPPPVAPEPTAGWRPLDDHDLDVDLEDYSDEPYVQVQRRPSDMLVMTPVLLILAAIGGFFLSVLSGSTGLRTFSILLVPVSGMGFVLAPLFVMLRSKSRSAGGEPRDRSAGGEPRNRSAGGEPRNRSAGGEPRNRSAGGEPRDDSAGGEPRDDSAGGEPRDGSAGGEPRDGSAGGEPRDGSAE